MALRTTLWNLEDFNDKSAVTGTTDDRERFNS